VCGELTSFHRPPLMSSLTCPERGSRSGVKAKRPQSGLFLATLAVINWCNCRRLRFISKVRIFVAAARRAAPRCQAYQGDKHRRGCKKKLVGTFLGFFSPHNSGDRRLTHIKVAGRVIKDSASASESHQKILIPRSAGFPLE
jgi:hypothetical protein